MAAEFLSLDTGEQLPVSVADYNADRNLPEGQLHAVCKSPFVGLDFSPTGYIRLCGCADQTVINIKEVPSLLDLWRGPIFQQYREQFSQYVLSNTNCDHCIRQLRAGVKRTAAIDQFDWMQNLEMHPPYPRKLVFRLNNTCNLACVMCYGETSSRIRKERDRLPLLPSAYPETFFDQLREIVPHVEYMEFAGGEPFLIQEHWRIFDMIKELNPQCMLYANTNATVLGYQVRELLETLNFRYLAISMDAVTPETHANVRHGINHEKFLANLDYLCELRNRKDIQVFLNVTEHRKNWFELPALFEFAETKNLKIHLNFCIHPHNVTLYTLPTEQLQYVYSYLQGQQQPLLDQYPEFSNRETYNSLLTAIQGELAQRQQGRIPVLTNVSTGCDGLLATPRVKVRPLTSADAVIREIDNIRTNFSQSESARMLHELQADLQMQPETEWAPAVRHVKHLLSESSYHVFRKLGLAYRAVAKTGSTSIVYTLGRLIGLEDTFYPHFMPFERLPSLAVNRLDLFRFATVRNPYDRLLSWWARVTAARFDRSLFGDTLSKGMQAVYVDMPFRDFVDLALQRPDEACNWHLKSQHFVLRDVTELDLIIRFESLTDDWEKLRHHCPQLPPLVKKLNWSAHGPWEDYYDDELRDRVYHRYQRDFELLGYPR